MIVALKLERNIVRPALGAFDKAIVEGGHGSWRIYTKNGSDPSAHATLFAFQIPSAVHAPSDIRLSLEDEVLSKNKQALPHGFLGTCGFSACAMALRNSSTA